MLSPTVLALLLYCHDGDTCRFLVHGKSTPVRFMGIDAPEIGRGARCAAEQSGAVKARDRLLVLLHTGERIELEVHGKDKYRRTLARVLVDGQDVGQELVQEGLVRRYTGGKRRPWCEK